MDANAQTSAAINDWSGAEDINCFRYGQAVLANFVYGHLASQMRSQARQIGLAAGAVECPGIFGSEYIKIYLM